MPYETSFEVLDDHVRVIVRGERVAGRVAADSKQVVNKTLQTLEEAGIWKCMVVLDLDGPLSPIDAFDLVEMSEAEGWPRDCRLALVNLRAESTKDARFTELVATNRAYLLRVFGDEQSALDWLLAENTGSI